MITKTIYECSCGKTSKHKSSVEKCEASHKEDTKRKEKLNKLAGQALDCGTLKELAEFLGDLIGYEVVFYNGFIGQRSNSHSSPRGKERNWSKDPKKPLAYFGWSGNISVGTKGYTRELGRNFDELRSRLPELCIEGGGSRDNGLDYFCTLWADDFPALGQRMRDCNDLGDRIVAANLSNSRTRREYSQKISDLVADDPEVTEAHAEIVAAKKTYYRIKREVEEKAVEKLGKPKLVEVPDHEIIL